MSTSKHFRSTIQGRAVARRAFTLVELLAVIAIIAVLASMAFVISNGVRKKAEQVQCGENLKTLHAAFGAYLQDHKRWPQVSSDFSDEKDYWAAWALALSDYDLPDKVWMCPTHKRVTKEEFLQYSSYAPTPFDGTSIMTPQRWRQPWVMEIGDNHGDGPLMIMADGSIEVGESFQKPKTTVDHR